MADEPRNPNRTERNAATSQRDHGGGPPKVNEPKQGRPNDLGSFTAPHPLPNSTLADRAKAAKKRGQKQVDDETDTENKAVSKSESKRK
jgi:hypothetical protein